MQLVYENLMITANAVIYQLDFTNKLTIIGGDSGIGKTFLTYVIKNMQLNEKQLKNISIFSYQTGIQLEEFLTVLAEKGHMLIIDNYDAFVTKKAAELIQNDKKNQYMIFARNARFLPVDRYTYAEFIKEKNIISFKRGE